MGVSAMAASLFRNLLVIVPSKSKVKDSGLRLDRYRNQLAIRIAAIIR